MILGHSYIKLRFRIEKVNVIRTHPLFFLIKGNQAQMAQNRMMNLSSSQELLHLKPKAFRPTCSCLSASNPVLLPAGIHLEFSGRG